MFKKFINFCETLVENSSKDKISVFDKLSISFILFDAVLIFIETFRSLAHLEVLFNVLIWSITGFFALEYFIRLMGHKDKLKFIKSAFGIVDLVSFLPMILTLGGFGFTHVRILRLLRFFKFTKYIKASRDVWDSILDIKDQLVGFLFVSFFFVYIFAISLFHFESKIQPEKMGSAIDALYLAMVTVTTLGYGDITPLTLFGRLLTIGFALLSLLFLTVPTSLFLASYQDKLKKRSSSKITRLPIENKKAS